MAPLLRTLFFVALSILSLLACFTNAQLSTNFYDKTCPNLQTIVKKAMQQAINGEARLGASILRLFFHDCFMNVRLQILRHFNFYIYVYVHIIRSVSCESVSKDNFFFYIFY